ncbi:hypothetical protein ACFC58_06275 [Kitasatospora purpeofusca]|uniref:hypothetical protein n=1 Tax=Kitasatospora purpeofusca TaxID=67352 RepID=UPI0035D7B53B
MSTISTIAIDAAPIIDAVLAETPLHIGRPFAFEYQRSGRLVAVYRDTLAAEHRTTVAAIVADRFQAAGWNYWHQYVPGSDVVSSTQLTQPTDASGEFTVRPHGMEPLGLGAALASFADRFGHLDAAHEVGRSLQCVEVAAVAALLSALGREGEAASWRTAHAEFDQEHAERCSSASAAPGPVVLP